MNAQEIWNTAKAAAQAAAEAHNASLPAENKRGFDCGFAWITIRPARGPFVTYLKTLYGPAKSYSGGAGYGIWYRHLHSVPTQSESVHYAAALAAAEVLKAHGINASASSRSD